MPPTLPTMRTLALCLSFSLLVGCSDSITTEQNATGTTPAKETEQIVAQAKFKLPEKVEVKYGTWEEIDQFRQELKGKVVVIDTWSTWCIPCLREFPNFVALQNEFPQDVVCISLNLNYEGIEGEKPQEYEEEVLGVLKKFDAKLVNYISSQDSESIYQQMEFDALPAVFLYDQQGKLIKRFDNTGINSAEDAFSYEKDIIPEVKALLKSK